MSAFAQAEPAPELLKYAGTYKFDGTKEQFFAITDKARDEGLAQLNLVFRMMAKKAMESQPKVFIDTIAIDLAGDKIGIKSGNQERMVVAPGKSEPIVREGKTIATLTRQFEGGKIIQTVTGEDKGQTVTAFTLSADGKTLTLDLTTTHPKMPKPVKCQLTYKRQ